MDELHELIQRAQRSRRSRANAIIADCASRLPRYRHLPKALLAEVPAKAPKRRRRAN